MKMGGIIVYNDMYLTSMEESEEQPSSKWARSKIELINNFHNKLFIRMSDSEIH